MTYLDLSDAFDRFFYPWPEPNLAYKPPMTIEYMTDSDDAKKSVLIQFAVAGFTESDINVYQEDRTLVVKGDNTEKEGIAGKFTMNFTRKLSIKNTLDIDNTNVELKDGILSITIPVKTPIKTHKTIFGGGE